MSTDLSLVLTTEADQIKAGALAEQLITLRLAACVSLMPVQSCYRWKGEIERSQEVQLLIKTSSQRLEQLISGLEALHSYATPEILHLPAQAGDAYAAWALGALNPDAPSSAQEERPGSEHPAG
ncbi:divalent-cation tolerance protein CutA [Synechococcus sp. UW179A]|uniref:divalent-cation tolerance protein CutA n=1 Tax=Synechococcus sp. UW179A TaxID=2575510 RepID=UPI00352EEEB6